MPIDGFFASSLLSSVRVRAAGVLAMKPGLSKLCLGSRVFSNKDLEKTLGDLGVGNGTELTCVPMTGAVLGSRAYAMTEALVGEGCLTEAAQAEFGADVAVADFSTLKEDADATSAEEFVNFMDQLGLQSAKLLDGRQQFWAGNRQYFCERHDGNVRSGWLVHKTIHRNLLDLGSWNIGPMHVLVDLGKVA